MPQKILESDVEFAPIRASGPGGQHVNKVSSAVQLRFDIANSTLANLTKERLLSLSDQRINKEGYIVVKAQRFRSQDKNKQDALERLQSLVDRASAVKKRRVATKPSRSSREKRLKNKKRLSDKKSFRGSKTFD